MQTITMTQELKAPLYFWSPTPTKALRCMNQLLLSVPTSQLKSRGEPFQWCLLNFRATYLSRESCLVPLSFQPPRTSRAHWHLLCKHILIYFLVCLFFYVSLFKSKFIVDLVTVMYSVLLLSPRFRHNRRELQYEERRQFEVSLEVRRKWRQAWIAPYKSDREWWNVMVLKPQQVMRRCRSGVKPATPCYDETLLLFTTLFSLQSNGSCKLKYF